MFLKKYSLHIGLVFSAITAMLASMPLLLWFSVENISAYFTAILYFFFFALLLWIGLQWLAGYTSLRQKRHQISYFLLGFSVVLALALIFEMVNTHWIKPPIVLLREMDPSRKTYLTLFRSFLIGMLESFFIYFLDVQKEKQEKILEIEHLKQAQLEVKLSSLKEQLSPHFLFNTLNTLAVVAKEEALKVFVNELANVYRYVLQQQKSNTSTLESELGFVRSYLYIIKTRLEEAIHIDICVDEGLFKKQIPPLTLQLLLENAIKHNIASLSRPLYLRIRNTADGCLELSNNYQPRKSTPDSFGVGLNNVKERYRLLFNKEISIHLQENQFIIKLPLL
ncbi:MAG: hypothetical protein EOO88_06440 [Pedobacter sp.]|nr:MAG: hypothetical protein EOO88_06440 [Pedobacter sp.]